MNEHARAHDLLPWMVNGRIEARDAAWLESHLDGCARCRAELAAQQRVRDAIAREPTVELAPQAAFNRLWKRIEDSHAIASNDAAPVAAPPRATRSERTGRWLKFVALAQAAAIAVLCVALWRSPPPAAYRTVTDPPPGTGSNGPVVKAIFDDQVRLADVKEILAASGLVVASGPSEAGVYTLVPRDAGAADIPPVALARLHADPRVRFAEPGAR
ncbi:MAG: zf-HC2 domain-containing protein [Gammaproteobacteria bacterium]|nr:zf-HC2 domain-containing protein [Gammaproteobacteria bacterium]MDE2251460.1 zf-HC2 domain-containing protein [Gammaproteobacteria bacterium]